ncbi:heavy metal translocating P-type ATPase [Parasporobacterium paucivorans]|uniref:Cd(2+)-exporting ATPase n=1 Tax=Parasporobacterium paucivorans DSM 15970 TaxID=1122934 RepID=A0A1M6LCM0_9FIRM|nr:heavy metal translocating P-type ATPase [Parasporobacterium paucivorans]SHJ68927.1 Cd2+/Zn2+-exporting ATPase [Parasporobacterium paucivorans DSM 15970]
MKFNRELSKIIITAVLFILVQLIPFEKISLLQKIGNGDAELFSYLIIYIIIGGAVLKEAASNIRQGEIFDENFLMSIATVGAFFIGEYPEAVAVMLFYQVGEFFQSYAVDKSRKSVSALMDIRPDSAYLKQKDGSVVKVHPEDVNVGQVIVVRPGEKVPLDGTVISGAGDLDVRALTGESLPREAVEGDAIISGSVNINGLFEIIVEKKFTESTVSKILELVENAGNKKAVAENFITKFARIYTPFVVFAAVVIAVAPPLFAGGVWSDWIYRALTFLVISCPCAFVISVPMSFFGGIGGASRRGILIKGSNYIETLAKCNTIVFDKTGTLTKGVFRLEKINALGVREEELLETAAIAEYYSNHPIARSIMDAFQKSNPERYGWVKERIAGATARELPGFGMQVSLSAEGGMSEIIAGNKRLFRKEGIEIHEEKEVGSVVYVAKDGVFLGSLEVSDEIRSDAVKGINLLKKYGIRNTVMLTGDKESAAQKIGKQLGIDRIFSELLPMDKVSKLEEIMGQSDSPVVYVGDGINDAPVLARADVGIAMGGLGSDAAIEAADIVIMDDKVGGVSEAIRISRKTLRIVNQNVVFAFGVKLIVLVLAAMGIADMWPAVFADVGVATIAILNALRALR